MFCSRYAKKQFRKLACSRLMRYANHAFVDMQAVTCMDFRSTKRKQTQIQDNADNAKPKRRLIARHTNKTETTRWHKPDIACNVGGPDAIPMKAHCESSSANAHTNSIVSTPLHVVFFARGLEIQKHLLRRTGLAGLANCSG